VQPAPMASLLLTSMRGRQSLLVRPAALTIDFVFKKLHAIAIEKGSGAAGRRQRFVVGLINRCRCADHTVCSHGEKVHQSTTPCSLFIMHDACWPVQLRWLRVADGMLTWGEACNQMLRLSYGFMRF